MDLYAKIISLDENPKKHTDWVYPDKKSFMKKQLSDKYSYSSRLKFTKNDIIR